MNDRVAIVVIGRNEGERLRACLESLHAPCSAARENQPLRDEWLERPLSMLGRTATQILTTSPAHAVIYVDSGSTDNSVALARTLGAHVVELDMTQPFSAARGRNAGIAALQHDMPDYIQFVDGDCTLDPEWIEAATAFLDAHPRAAAAAGILRERHPEASIYNRLCELEWNPSSMPQSEQPVDSVGGIAMYRAAALTAAGGFNPAIRAGEEPELCLRLRDAGWKIFRVDHPMARHDAAIHTFRAWWKRVTRGGEGGMDVYMRTRGRLFAPMVHRAFLWVLLPLIVTGSLTAWLILCGRAVWLTPTFAAVLAIYGAQAMRMARRGTRAGLSASEACCYGVLSVLSKFAEAWGMSRWCKSRRITIPLPRFTKRHVESAGPSPAGGIR